MKKYLLAATGALALSLSANANAALLVINISGDTGSFGRKVVCSGGCMFTDVGTFITPVGYQLVGGSISTIQTGTNLATNIDFKSVLLNGFAWTLSPNAPGEGGFVFNRPMTPGGTNTLSVSGYSGGSGEYRGTLSFAAVPEPSTWLMMILGVGLAGAALRRRRQTVKVSYA